MSPSLTVTTPLRLPRPDPFDLWFAQDQPRSMPSALLIVLTVGFLPLNLQRGEFQPVLADEAPLWAQDEEGVYEQIPHYPRFW
jgi:hypothetical protein